MEKYLINVVKYYYWPLVLIAASLMFGFRDTSSILILIVVATTFICCSHIRYKIFDCLVFLYLIYCLITYFFVDYAYESRLYYLGIRSQIIPILFYFIARSNIFKSDDFFENFRLPLFFAMVCGLYFYFFQPSFYMNFKISVIWSVANTNINDLSGHLLYELTRLSSFWGGSYFIGYSSLFLFMYVSKKIIVDNYYRKFDVACFIISFFCLFFAQQRVSIAFCGLFFLALTIYATLKKLPARNLLYILWIGAIVVGMGIFFVAINLLGSDFIDYVLNRTVNYDGNLVGDRLGLFDKFVERLTVFGDGLGRYGHDALTFGYAAIPDSDYVRIPAEFGFVGLFMLLSICLYSFICGMRIFKYAFFEICALAFCMVAMIGSAVWEYGMLQPFLYWFCIGHIQSKFDRRTELKNEYEACFKEQKDVCNAVEEN